MRKLERVKCDHARDAAARANAGNLRVRISRDVREIADERGHCDQRKIAKRPQKILHVIAEDEQEIDVANEMQDARVKKK